MKSCFILSAKSWARLYPGRPFLAAVAVLLGCGAARAQDAIHIDHAGNVGISTSAPQGRLDVRDSSNGLTRSSFINNSTGAGSRQDVQIGAGNNNLFIGLDNGVGIFGAGSKAYLDNRTGGPMLFGTNGFENVRIAADGTIGINTTSTGAYQATIKTNADATNGLLVQLNDNTSAAYSMRLEHNGSNLIVRPSQSNRSATIVENTAGNLLLNPASGNVGIGTATPAELLQIGNSTGASSNPGLLLQSSSNTDGQGGIIKFRETGGAYGMNIRHNTQANDEATNVEGLYFEGVNNDNVTRIMTIDQDRNRVGIGTSTPASALDVNGEISLTNLTKEHCVGTIRLDQNGVVAVINASCIGGRTYLQSSGQWYAPSDRRVKENIFSIKYGLDAVMRLRPVSFNYITSADKRPTLGFIAQEAKEVVPESVDYNTGTDRYSMSYVELVPVLTKAIQELSKQVDILKQQNEQLRATCSASRDAVSAMQARLDALDKKLESLTTARLTAGQ